MFYLSISVLILCVVFIIVFSGYHRRTLKDLYHMHGVYMLLYPPACFLYNLFLKKTEEKRLIALKKIYPGENVYIMQRKIYLHNISNTLMILIAVNVAVIVFYLSGTGQSALIDGLYVERSAQGEGSRTIDLVAWIEDESQEVSLTVGEKRVNQEGMEAFWTECEAYIREKVIGMNSGSDHILQDLDFFAQIPEYSVGVQWQTSDYNIVGMDGKVKNENIENPVSVKLTAICSYYDEIWEYSFDVIVLPAEKDAKLMRQEALYSALLCQESNTACEDFLILPDNINGKEIVWTQKSDSPAGVVLLLGCLCIILIFARENEKNAKAQKSRAAQLVSDYPVFVHKIVLLLGSGMTSKAAWFRIISDYNKSLEKGGKKRYVYEEMIVAANEMKQGVTEITAYENFGRRCQTSQYLKFSSILIQSVKTGAKGMSRILSDAGAQALILRRENAKRMGEEAGMKLLFPMVVLLGVVMSIVMIPAFMSMNF